MIQRVSPERHGRPQRPPAGRQLSAVADQFTRRPLHAALRGHPEQLALSHPTQPNLGPQAGTTLGPMPGAASPITPAPGASDISPAVAAPAGPPLLLVPLSLAPAAVGPDAAVLSRAARAFNPSIEAGDTPDSADFAKAASRANIGRAKVSRIVGGVPLSFVEDACTQKPTTIALDAPTADALNVRGVVTNATAGNADATALLVGGVGWGG